MIPLRGLKLRIINDIYFLLSAILYLQSLVQQTILALAPALDPWPFPAASIASIVYCLYRLLSLRRHSGAHALELIFA